MVSCRPSSTAAYSLALQRSLSSREREMLQLVGEGITNQEIAARLDLSINTVQSHRAAVMMKLSLTRGEFRLLERLAKGPEMVISHKELLSMSAQVSAGRTDSTLKG